MLCGLTHHPDKTPTKVTNLHRKYMADLIGNRQMFSLQYLPQTSTHAYMISGLLAKHLQDVFEVCYV